MIWFLTLILFTLTPLSAYLTPQEERLWLDRLTENNPQVTAFVSGLNIAQLNSMPKPVLLSLPIRNELEQIGSELLGINGLAIRQAENALIRDNLVPAYLKDVAIVDYNKYQSFAAISVPGTRKELLS